MWNKLSIAFLFFSISFSLYSEEGNDVMLRWADVPNSLGYILEIKNKNDKIVLSKKINATKYELKDFEPGTYIHRVGVINKFGKVEGYTDWAEFEVVRTKVPIIYSKNVFSAGKEENIKQIEVKGKNYLNSMKVYLKKDGKIVPARSVQVVNDGLVRAEFKIQEFEDVGMYDLVLENPKKKTAIRSRNFVLGRDSEQAEKIANREKRIINKEIPEDYYATPYWSTLWRSTVLPGWGQDYIDEARWKVYVYPILVIGAAGAYAKGYQDFLVARKDYVNSVQTGFLLNTINDSELLFLYNNQTATAKYDTAKQRLEQIQIGAGVVAVFALYNIIDAYLSVRKNVVLNDKPGIRIPESGLRIRTNSFHRPTSHWEASRWESFSHIELFMRF